MMAVCGVIGGDSSALARMMGASPAFGASAEGITTISDVRYAIAREGDTAAPSVFLDLDNDEIVLFRDHAGVSELYYAEVGAGLCFGSDLRSVIACGADFRIDSLGLGLFFDLGFTPGSRTLVANVFKLRPGERRRYRLSDARLVASKVEPFAEASLEIEPFSGKKLRTLLEQAVVSSFSKPHSSAILLDGGLESWAILHLAQNNGFRPSTFGLRFTDPRFHELNQEADKARMIAGLYNAPYNDIMVDDDMISEAYSLADGLMFGSMNQEEFFVPALTAIAAERASISCDIVIDGAYDLFGGRHVHHRSAELCAAVEKGAGIEDVFDSFGRSVAPISPAFDLADPVHRWFALRRLAPIDSLSGKAFKKLVSDEETLDYLRECFKPYMHNITPLSDELAIDRISLLADFNLNIRRELVAAKGRVFSAPFVFEPLTAYAQKAWDDISEGQLDGGNALRLAMKPETPRLVSHKPAAKSWRLPFWVWKREHRPDVFEQTLKPAPQELLDIIDADGLRAGRDPRLQSLAAELVRFVSKLTPASKGRSQA